MKALARISPVLLALLCACGGGGGSTPTPMPLPTNTVATVTPTPAGTATPSPAPTHSASPAPITSPTPIPLAIAAAPAQVYTAQGLLRRSAADAMRQAQSVNLGNGGVPTIVVGYSATMGAIFSQLYVWAQSATAIPIPVQEASLNVTTTGPLAIQSVSPDNSNLFAATYFDWIVNPGTLTGTGKIMLNAAFPNVSGGVPYYSYDKWNLTCAGVLSPADPNQWGYKNGVPVGFSGNNDVNLDCVNSINFPNGASLISAPTADIYGNLATAFTSVIAPTFSNPITTLPLANLQVGAVYLIKTTDGGYMKFMALQNTQPSTGFNASLFGISLHDSPNGSGRFSF
jgi:hypothetical protein